MKKIRLFLVRHGNTFETGEVCTHVGLRSDMALTDEGRLQAKRFASFLKSHNLAPTAVYAGTLKRQSETAQIILQELKEDDSKVVFLKALNEIDYGPWEGLSTEQILEGWKEAYENWTEAGEWPADIFQEAFEERISLLRGFISEIRSSYEDDAVVVVVSSNGILRLFQTFIPGRWEELQRERRVKELKVGTGNFCEMLLRADTLEVRRWNAEA